MNQLHNSYLVKAALNKLAEEDYVARAIIAYYSQLDEIADLMKRGYYDNEKLKSYGNSYNYLSKIFKEVLDKDYEKVKDKSDYNKFTTLYLLNNLEKLYTNEKIAPYKDGLLIIRKNISKYFTDEMLLAIMLRANYIISKLSKLDDAKALERFISLLEKTRDSEDNILVNVYYGLYDGKIKNKIEIDDEKKQENKLVLDQLLNSKEKLPDSIITELCTDKQFINVNPEIIKLIIHLFFKFNLFPKLPDDDLLDIIQKIFYNNVRDFNSKAEFLDLEEFIKEVEESFDSYEPGFKFEKHFIEIINGIDTLPRKEDKNSYGSI